LKPDPSILSQIQQWVDAEASAQVVEKLQQYVDLVLATNAQYNLMGPKEADHIWQRHILDSAQLYSMVQDLHPRLVMDIGSGAGFPGIVLSIMGVEQTILVESIQKKAKFLQQVIDTLGLPAEVRPERVEDLNGPIPDVITARAISALDNILTWTRHLCYPTTTLLLLKGEKAQEEIDIAQKHWRFEYTLTPSVTSPTGQIIKLWGLRKY
jgi:16S rRNA (guanine527-N7)-methyltransferase